jgi:hypothetical protein
MRFCWIALLASLLLSGCASVDKQASILQKRQVESKMVQGNMTNVFPAVMTVLQDSDFNIDQASKDAGFIAATRMKDLSSSQKFWGEFWAGYNAKKGDAWKLTCTLEQETPTECALRLTITALAYNEAGINTDAQPVDDPAVIQNFLNQIQTEVKRREALNAALNAPAPGATPTVTPNTTPATVPAIGGSDTTVTPPKGS